CKDVWDARTVDDFDFISPKFLNFQAGDGTTLYGELLLPSRPEANGKVPLVVYIYGGPAGQTVRNEWPHDLFHQIFAHDGFAIFTVDNRGTPGRDRKFQTAV